MTIDDVTIPITNGKGTYNYDIIDNTLRQGTTLTATFNSPDYEQVSDDVIIYRNLIPTTTVVDEISGTVGTPTTITATVTSSNGRPVSQGKVTFTYNGQTIGTVSITDSNPIADNRLKRAAVTDTTVSIDVVFNNTIEDGLVIAEYVDDAEGEDKIFENSISSSDISESGRTNIDNGEAEITAVATPDSGIPGEISVVDITVTDKNTGLPINGTVTIDGVTIPIVNGKGTYNYEIVDTTSRDGTTLTAQFNSPDYNAVSDDVVISRELIPTVTEATVLNNTVGNVTVRINVTDTINNEAIKNGSVELYVNGTLIGKGEIVDGIVDVVTDITEVGIYDITIKFMGDNTYLDSEDLLEDVEVISLEPRIITIGYWKLVCFNVTPEDDTDNDTVPSNNNKVAPKNNMPKYTVKYSNNYQRSTAKQQTYHNQYRYNKKYSRTKPSRNTIIPPMSKVQYRLYIVLLKEYLEGDISFEDFVVILKLNGIEIATLNDWNENGEIIIDYDNLEDVPDTIEILDNSGQLEDYSQSINKNNAPSSSGEIDSGDIEVQSKSSNAGSSNAAGSGLQSSNSNSQYSGDSGVVADGGE